MLGSGLTAFRRFVKARNALDTIAGAKTGFIVTKTNDTFHAAAKDGKLYIGADSFENGTWEKDLIHEYTHFSEGSAEYAKLANFLVDEDLIVDTKNGKQALYKVAAESVLSKGYGFTAEEIGAIIDKKQAGKDLTAEEADKYSVFNDELMAHATEHLLGNEAFIDKLVAKDAPLARKIFDMLVADCKTIGGNGASKTLRTAQKLYIKAAEQSGNTRLAKYFLSHAPEIEEEESLDSESEVQYNRKGATVKKKKQTYSQYYSTVMQWAFSSRTKPGDIKVLYNPQDNTWNKLVADETEDRYGTLLSIEDSPENAEAIRNLWKEVKNENYGEEQRPGESVYEDYVAYRSIRRGNRNDDLDAQERDANGRYRELYGEESESNRSGDPDESARNRRTVKFSLKDSAGTPLTEAQVEYFKDSKVRDKDGNLLVVYHGSRENFNVFDITKSRSYDERPDYDLPGFYFSESDMESGGYGDNVKAYYVNVTNPYEGDTYQLRKDKGTFRKVYDYLVSEGYDGIIDTEMGEGFTEIIAFHPERIKLTTNKTPTRSSDIRFSKKYQSAEKNGEILSLIEKINDGAFKDNDKVLLGSVSPLIASKIQGLTGVDVRDFKIAIEARQLKHILKDHGKNGLTDRSMADPSDIAKMQYVLESPGDISYAGKTQAYTYTANGRNKTADTVLYEKEIGEKSYYVVQAVPDTKAKTLYIVTAFIGKKGYKKEASQLINAKSPDATPPNGSAITSSNDSIAQESNSVKRKKSTAQLSLKSPNPGGATYQISDGQIKKMIANYTRSKTYSKKEADEAIHEILKDTLYAEDEKATLRGKSREEVVNMLWQGLNAAEPGKRGAVANKDKICGVGKYVD